MLISITLNNIHLLYSLLTFSKSSSLEVIFLNKYGTIDLKDLLSWNLGSVSCL